MMNRNKPRTTLLLNWLTTPYHAPIILENAVESGLSVQDFGSEWFKTEGAHSQTVKDPGVLSRSDQLGVIGDECGHSDIYTNEYLPTNPYSELEALPR